jgi:hypothetical protein
VIIGMSSGASSSGSAVPNPFQPQSPRGFGFR